MVLKLKKKGCNLYLCLLAFKFSNYVSWSESILFSACFHFVSFYYCAPVTSLHYQPPFRQFFCTKTPWFKHFVLLYIVLEIFVSRFTGNIRLTCFNSRSELGEQQVTRCFVKCRKEASVSGVRWSLEHLCSMWEITRNPRHCSMCCWTVLQDSTKEQTNPSSFEL